jgi:hypothetical protein
MNPLPHIIPPTFVAKMPYTKYTVVSDEGKDLDSGGDGGP